MTRLDTILSAIDDLVEVRGERAVDFGAIRYDSRRVSAGDLYVAINGRDDHGLEYVDAAIAAGAVVVVLDAPERLAQTIDTRDVTIVVVGDARRAMARLANTLAGDPSRNGLRLYGVTGTNGKTTTTYVLRQLLSAAGLRTGVIGTLGVMIGEEIVPTGYTTPESPELVGILRDMLDAGLEAVSMEVSSHALALHRVHGLRFDGAVFTNLTQDHLDFHSSMQEYRDAKKLLFDELEHGRPAVVNIDDPAGRGMVRDTHGVAFTYGTTDEADARIDRMRLGADGTRWILELSESLGGGSIELRSPLLGAFNVANVTSAVVLALALGIDRAAIVSAVERLQPVPGRMESIAIGGGATAVVDYAHTPDALENAIRSLREIGSGKLTVLFGCGGDRDRSKRPMMGEIASRLADRVVVTSDNPRSEAPEAIIRQIEEGIVAGATVETIVDRAEAIEHAVRSAVPGEIVLVAGKGHEDYQIVGAERRHFDDREVVRSAAESRRASVGGRALA